MFTTVNGTTLSWQSRGDSWRQVSCISPRRAPSLRSQLDPLKIRSKKLLLDLLQETYTHLYLRLPSPPVVRLNRLFNITPPWCWPHHSGEKDVLQRSSSSSMSFSISQNREHVLNLRFELGVEISAPETERILVVSRMINSWNSRQAVGFPLIQQKINKHKLIVKTTRGVNNSRSERNRIRGTVIIFSTVFNFMYLVNSSFIDLSPSLGPGY